MNHTVAGFTEPPDLSVVLDGRRLAWQRIGDKWFTVCPMALTETGAHWLDLWLLGPLTVIYEN